MYDRFCYSGDSGGHVRQAEPFEAGEEMGEDYIIIRVHWDYLV